VKEKKFPQSFVSKKKNSFQKYEANFFEFDRNKHFYSTVRRNKLQSWKKDAPDNTNNSTQQQNKKPEKLRIFSFTFSSSKAGRWKKS